MKNQLSRKLTLSERQAFEGARDFYFIVIPAVVVATLSANISISYSDPGKDAGSLLQVVSEGLVAVGSYIVALKYYKLCHSIDTTPVLPSEVALEGSQAIIEGQSDRLLGSVKPDKFYCQVCQMRCEYRARHCRKCQVCVERYDHHCFWIGNCVGRHNHRQFYLFLAAQTINNIAVFLLISRLQALHGWEWWLQCLGRLLALGFCGFTGWLLFYHTMLVSCGITTWEHMRRTKISYLKYLPPGFNPFSRGVVQNWKLFLSEETRASGSEKSQSWDEDVVAFEEAKRIKAGCNIIENEYYSCC